MVILCIDKKLFSEFHEQAQSFMKAQMCYEDTWDDQDWRNEADDEILNWYEKRYYNAQELMAFTRAMLYFCKSKNMFLRTVEEAVLCFGKQKEVKDGTMY